LRDNNNRVLIELRDFYRMVFGNPFGILLTNWPLLVFHSWGEWRGFICINFRIFPGLKDEFRWGEFGRSDVKRTGRKDVKEAGSSFENLCRE
jgi:hypothetical protein